MPSGKPGEFGVVYGLLDPTHEHVHKNVRYVGYTTNDPARRLRSHIQEARRRGGTHRRNWIRSLLIDGKKPEMSFLQHGVGERLPMLERSWINLLMMIGCDLVNGTDGGEGCPGHEVTEEQREKLRAIGKANAERHRQAAIKMWEDPEYRERHSGDNHHMKRPELRAKWVGENNPMAKKGSHTEETIQKISEALTGIPRDKTTKAKIAAALTGKPKSEDHKNNLSKSRWSVDEATRLSIRMARANGKSYAQISRETGVGYSTVYRICTSEER